MSPVFFPCAILDQRHQSLRVPFATHNGLNMIWWELIDSELLRAEQTPQKDCNIDGNGKDMR